MCDRFFSLRSHSREHKSRATSFDFLRHLLGALTASILLTTASSAAPAAQKTPETVAALPHWEQLADTVFQNYTTDHGLPNAVVTAVAEDGDGFLWVGTQGGLARWDGYHFRNYVPDPKDAGSLPDNWIMVLHADNRGRLWIGTQSGGLARYDREHDRFIHITLGTEATSNIMIRDIADDVNGGLWIATSKGLDHLDQDTGAFSNFRHDDQNASSLPGDRVTALLQDHLGTLWVGTTKGLARRDKGNNSFVVIPLPGYDEASIVKLCESSNGRLWIGTKKGAYVLDSQTGAAQAVQGNGPEISLPTENVRAIVEAGQGEVWLGTEEGGIYAVDMNTLHTRRIQHDPKLNTSLADDNIWALYRDKAGLLWVGTNFGLGRNDPVQSAVLTLSGVGNVGSILPAQNQFIWFGIGNNGVDIVDPAGNRLAELRADPEKPDTALQKGVISALATSPDGDVYLGAGHDLYRANPSGTKLTRIALPPDSATTGVQALQFDGTRLWIGSVSDGLWQLDTAGTMPSAVRADGTDKLSDRRITALEPGPHGTLWVGTRNGLNRFDPATHTVERIVPKPSEENTPTGLISSLLTDRKGRLWVATMGSGIHVLESQDTDGSPRFHWLGTAEGLPNANVDKLLMDSAGNVWASTDDGIAFINSTTFAVRALRRMDGVAISGYWFGSGAVTSEGELLFGGPGGLTVVRPDRLKDWTYRPSVVVTDVQIGGKTVPAGWLNNANTAAQHTDPLTINPDANSLAIEFSALDYSAPEHNRYAYWLEGYDKTWIDTDPARRLAAYTNLPPGSYRLHLRGSNRNGVWVGSELTLPIRVQPDWYQTWWFHIVEVALLVAIVLVSTRIWTVRLTRQRNALEEEVKKRTAEVVLQKKLVEQKNELIVQKVQELETSNDALALANQIQEEQKSELTRFLAVASHDLRQPMHALNIYLEALLDVELSGTAKPLAGKVQQCAHIMDDMFKALLDLSRLDAHVVKPRIESFPIASLLKRLEIEFLPQATIKGLSLKITPCVFSIQSDAALVEQILRNLIANAVRYTEDGTITVTCHDKDGRLLISVQDTGIGISPHQQKTVFEEFCQLGVSSRDRSKGLGLGLAIVRRLCALLDAPITLISAVGQGSTFTVDLPLAQGTDSVNESLAVIDAPVKVSLRNKLIVLIDDEESILDAMQTRLEQCGATVLTATSGNEAIAKLKTAEQIPDAIICDYQLRLNENGIDAIGAIHSVFSDDIPVLLVTGDTAPEAIRETQESGMLVLHKPIQPGMLLTILSQICQQASPLENQQFTDEIKEPVSQ